LKIALVGCGRIAINHISAAVSLGIEVVALCDIELEKAKRVKSEFGLENVLIFKDYRELFQIEIDIISVTTSTGDHFNISKYVLENNFNLIVEKPITLSLEEVDELNLLAISNSVKATICHQNRFNFSVQRLIRSISSNSLGKLYYGVASIRWNRNKDYYNQAEWRGKWRSDGGALMNQSIHNIDLLLWMMGSPVVEVFGYIDNKNHPLIEVEDMGVALLKFANGSYGIIESSMNTYPENFEETLSIFGEKGTVVLGGKSVNKIVHWNVKNDPIDDLDEFNEEVDSVYGNGHVALYKDLIEAIESRREPAVTLQDGRNAVEVILAIYLSSFEKRPVQLPLTTDTSTIMFEGKLIK
jgi:UDP-N-acetyl-2-amino-2-deoxyglucuronate dehydrogenase